MIGSQMNQQTVRGGLANAWCCGTCERAELEVG